MILSFSKTQFNDSQIIDNEVERLADFWTMQFIDSHISRRRRSTILKNYGRRNATILKIIDDKVQKFSKFSIIQFTNSNIFRRSSLKVLKIIDGKVQRFSKFSTTKFKDSQIFR
ncbi:hypothetical protein CDAR_607661 [Caerostris darwini]|uniref:Uncharacterized protein n=1 Tax=Caerostris darwini TaxID=1538125 RepID=A0AAV4UL81_9ARAC|nr:hypothetical protein CDAR_607661 [Caerostris darwini]